MYSVYLKDLYPALFPKMKGPQGTLGRSQLFFLLSCGLVYGKTVNTVLRLSCPLIIICLATILISRNV